MFQINLEWETGIKWARRSKKRGETSMHQIVVSLTPTNHSHGRGGLEKTSFNGKMSSLAQALSQIVNVGL